MTRQAFHFWLDCEMHEVSYCFHGFIEIRIVNPFAGDIWTRISDCLLATEWRPHSTTAWEYRACSCIHISEHAVAAESEHEVPLQKTSQCLNGTQILQRFGIRPPLRDQKRSLLSSKLFRFVMSNLGVLLWSERCFWLIAVPDGHRGQGGPRHETLQSRTAHHGAAWNQTWILWILSGQGWEVLMTENLTLLEDLLGMPRCKDTINSHSWRSELE